MYNIGFIRTEVAEFKADDGTDKKVIWQECYFFVPGMEKFTAKLTKNKNKNSDNAPDYFLYRRSKFNKSVSFRDIKIGALWIKSKTVDNVTTKYMTGNMLLGAEEVNIGVFKAVPTYEGEQLNHLYDITLFTDASETTQSETKEGYVKVNEYQIEPPIEKTEAEIAVDEEDIPF